MPEIEVYESDYNEFTVVIGDSVYVMNARPTRVSGGVNQYIGQVGKNGIVRSEFGDEIPLEEAPDSVQEAIDKRLEDFE